MLLRSAQHDVVNAMFMEPTALPVLILDMGTRLIATVAVATIVLVAADLVWSRVFWQRELRMTRQEVKDEMKQVDGDPIVKARLRSLARDRMRKRMIAAVPKATLVIANPTHYAVALRYVREEGGAPLVVAKGQDLIALKIREVATEHGIPVIEDKALARSLYKAVEVDKMIPPEFYKAVAEIVFFLFGRQARTRPLARNRHAEARQELHLRSREGAGRRSQGRGFRAAPDRCRRSHRLHPHRAVRQYRQPGEFVDRALLQAGHLSFGLSGDIKLKWGEAPSVSLDMEFHHMRVAVYFRLLLQALQAGIEIDYITFEEGSADPEANTTRLVEAIADARLTPIPSYRLPASVFSST